MGLSNVTTQPRCDVLFLPGIIAPATVRYAALLPQLPEVNACVTDLAIYAGDAPPKDYSIDLEVANILANADRAGFSRFHLYAHSGGGACALAFAARYPERLLSLAIDEPASDLTAADHADPYWHEIAAARELPGPAATAEFIRLQLAPGVAFAPPPGPPPPWMAKRPAAIRVISTELQRYEVDPDRFRALRAPVLYTFGSKSHPRWLAMRDRLKALLPDFRDELFEGLHHLNTSHQAEPVRTAALLREFWTHASNLQP
jgi:pimeloyl-ACP methyl ester carboxylesterase